MPGIILGWDFLSKKQLGITWGPEEILQLGDNQDIPVQVAKEFNDASGTLTAKTTIPPRNLVLVSVTTKLPPTSRKTRFGFTPLQDNPHLGLNCIVYPLDYATMWGDLRKVLIHLGRQEIKLQQGTLLGHFYQAPQEEIMITEEDIFGVNFEQPWTSEEIEEEVLKGDNKGFITSPVDVDPRTCQAEGR